MLRRVPKAEDGNNSRLTQGRAGKQTRGLRGGGRGCQVDIMRLRHASLQLLELFHPHVSEQPRACEECEKQTLALSVSPSCANDWKRTSQQTQTEDRTSASTTQTKTVLVSTPQPTICRGQQVSTWGVRSRLLSSALYVVLDRCLLKGHRHRTRVRYPTGKRTQ